jgi:hypothetical protein
MIYMTRAMSSATVIDKYVPHLRLLADQIGRAAGARADGEFDEELAFPASWMASNGVRDLRQVV